MYLDVYYMYITCTWIYMYITCTCILLGLKLLRKYLLNNKDHVPYTHSMYVHVLVHCTYTYLYNAHVHIPICMMSCVCVGNY